MPHPPITVKSLNAASPDNGEEPVASPKNTKGYSLVNCSPLIILVRPAGFEPTTPWFVANKIENKREQRRTQILHITI